MGNAAYAWTAMLSQRKMTWAHLVPSFFPAHFLRIADPAEKEGEYPQDDQPEKAQAAQAHYLWVRASEVI